MSTTTQASIDAFGWSLDVPTALLALPRDVKASSIIYCALPFPWQK